MMCVCVISCIDGCFVVQLVEKQVQASEEKIGRLEKTQLSKRDALREALEQARSNRDQTLEQAHRHQATIHHHQQIVRQTQKKVNYIKNIIIILIRYFLFARHI